MLFSIDEDLGERIIGWLMPDNPAATPRIIVHLDREHRVAVEAFVDRPLLKEQGLHNTGICGFVADELNCPGIGAAADLKITDGENNVLIYRRHQGDDLIERKFLQTRNAVVSRFQRRRGADRPLPDAVSGVGTSAGGDDPVDFRHSVHELDLRLGPNFLALWEPLLHDRGFKIGILLRDPFEEMSERLLILKWASTLEAAPSANALMPILQTCVGAVREIDFSNAAALNELLSHPSDELRALLNNPLVYQLAAPNAFDPPPSPASAAALDSLAEFDAVGLREDVDSFLALVGAVLDLPQPLPPVSLAPSKTVVGFAGALREMSAARNLIQQDLELDAEARRVLAPAPAEPA